MYRTGSDEQTATFFNVARFCPRCGMDTLDNHDNCLQCSSCGLRYYINPPVSVIAVLIDREGRLLLTQRRYEPGKGKYDFPGGFVDSHETLEQALVREIREELNLEIYDPSYLASFVTRYPYKGIVYYPVDTAFACKVRDWNPLQAQDDVATIRFSAVAEIASNDLAFTSHERLIQLLRKQPLSDRFGSEHTLGTCLTSENN